MLIKEVASMAMIQLLILKQNMIVKIIVRKVFILNIRLPLDLWVTEVKGIHILQLDIFWP